MSASVVPVTIAGVIPGVAARLQPLGHVHRPSRDRALTFLFDDQFGVSAGHGSQGCSALPASEAPGRAFGGGPVLQICRPQARLDAGPGGANPHVG
jgi:hypothetical protein